MTRTIHRSLSPSIKVSSNKTRKILLLVAASCVSLFLSTSSTNKLLPSLSGSNIFASAPTAENVSQGQDSAEERPGSLFDPVEIPLQCPRNSTQRRRVIDVTWVNSELPSLELRLNELWNVVDIFFISESTISWKAIPFKNQTLAPKPLYVTEHWDDFERFQSKMVIHVIPPEISLNTTYHGSYAIEMAQRDREWHAIQQVLNPKPDDLLIFADLDEIPRPGTIEKLACDPPDRMPPTPVCLHTKDSFYYYNYKCHIKFEWTSRPRVQLFQDGRTKCRSTMENASTHCSSCFGSLDYVRNKIMSNADPMEDSPLQLNNASILDRLRNCKDVYLRTELDKNMDFRESIDYGGIPLIVSKHPERWPYLLGKGPLYEEVEDNFTMTNKSMFPLVL
ncbi:hypothetical protein HJC23_004538 [Cyclotella cryptica]|uniref:Glycosyltransferase family 17 protein n=1 Tax=Cyclotella cryptica TaxID=29204 RepID=A0ABD3QBF6_9STRA|eukprot:CCRYP_007274-RA/>CCRYP_007274-RA protein AED:0.12 eAED:0.06 QI:0/-1/0/1/-1/1/1/0/391